MSRHISNFFFCLALFALPFVGVGSLELLDLPSLGMGLQPSVLLCLIALLLRGSGLWSEFARMRGALPLTALTMLIVIGVSSTWTLDDIGLFGEQPWLKSLKQASQFVLYALVGLTPAMLLREQDADDQLRQWERALTLGLWISGAYGLIQALDFPRAFPFVAAVDGWVSSNPSIAAGSHELYLGHRFVGIPRVRSTACEPLYFASYLLLALPVACAAATRWHRGWGRAWRLSAVVLGSACFVLTFSRGAYAAAGFGLLLGGGFWLRAGRPALGSRRSLLAAAAAAVVAAIFIAVFGGLAIWEIPTLLLRRVQQTFASHDMSNLTRFFAWEAGWKAFLQRPLVGNGWGSFGFLYYGLSPEGGAGAHFGWPVANSIPIRILAELGLLGVIASVWLFWPLLARLARIALSPRLMDPGAFLSILWVIAAFQGLSHSMLQLPHLWLLGATSLLIPRFRTALV